MYTGYHGLGGPVKWDVDKLVTINDRLCVWEALQQVNEEIGLWLKVERSAAREPAILSFEGFGKLLKT